MNELVFMRKDKPVTTSLLIAQIFGKEHKNVIRKIEEKMNLFGQLNFEQSSYVNGQGKLQPMYIIDRDFTTYLIMGFTGAKADEWKLKYIKAFNDMEDSIKKPMTIDEKIQIITQGTHDVTARIDKLENEMPLFGIESDEIAAHVKRKGVNLLGGKNTNAYHDSGIRSTVYRDIYDQLKREFGLYNDEGTRRSYKALKRKDIEKAHAFIESYKLPTFIIEKINYANTLRSVIA